MFWNEDGMFGESRSCSTVASLEHRSEDKEPQMVLVWILHIPTHRRYGHQGSAVGTQNSVISILL